LSDLSGRGGIYRADTGRVSFDWKDYAHRGQTKLMTLDAVEFLRRFLLHVLPSGLVRIRQFGFLAQRHRAHKLQLCRALLATQFPSLCDPTAAPVSANPQTCPNCKHGRLIVIEIVSAGPPCFLDTS
jgi:Putative transposase